MLNQPSPEHIARAERFLQQRMEEGERKEFLQDLETDPALRNAVRLLDSLADELAQTTPVPARPRRAWKQPWLLAAAVAVLMLLVWGIWSVNQPPPSGPELFAQHFSPYPIDVITRSTKGPSDKESAEREVGVEAAGEAYQQRDWPAAEHGFRALLQEDSTDLGQQFFLAQTLLAQQKPRQAIPILSEIARANSGYRNVAQWYLALAYLAADSTSRAIPTLEKIVNAAHSKTDSARLILLELGR